MTTRCKDKEWWEQSRSRNVPPEYETCYHRALLRMALALNCDQKSNATFPPALRKSSDIELGKRFRGKTINLGNAETALVNHETITGGKNFSDFDLAENLFYGDFQFNCPRGFKDIIRVTHRSTAAFRKWSFRNLYWPKLEEPQGSQRFLPKRQGETDSEFMMSCASNYLLKNFWHNFVHRQMQGITSANYHDFGGDAREHSDFEADNMGTVLFVWSYGISILTAGITSQERKNSVYALLRRNRCNRVFVERERHRLAQLKKMPLRERWHEAHWQFRRRLALAISEELIARGAAATSIAIYLRDEKPRGNQWFFFKGNVLVEINGRYIYTPKAPYIPDPAGPETERQRAFAYDRRQQLVRSAVDQYTALLSSSSSLREYAREGLQDVGKRINVPLS